MAKGYESSEREGRLRDMMGRICEAYACSELAVERIAGRDYCQEHVDTARLAVQGADASQPQASND